MILTVRDINNNINNDIINNKNNDKNIDINNDLNYDINNDEIKLVYTVFQRSLDHISLMHE